MRTTPRRVRAALVASALATAVLAGGCSFTSSTYNCSGGECDVSLSGAGADTELDAFSGEPELVLDGTSDGTADLSVAGESVSCAEGETVSAGGLSLECTSVGDDEVDVTVSEA